MGKVQGIVEEVSTPWYSNLYSDGNVLQWALPPTRLMLDASAGGALLNKSYAKAYELIESIAETVISGLFLDSTQQRKLLECTN